MPAVPNPVLREKQQRHRCGSRLSPAAFTGAAVHGSRHRGHGSALVNSVFSLLTVTPNTPGPFEPTWLTDGALPPR